MHPIDWDSFGVGCTATFVVMFISLLIFRAGYSEGRQSMRKGFDAKKSVAEAGQKEGE